MEMQANKSEFNSAFASLERIGDQLNKASYSREHKLADKWFDSIVSLYAEISVFLDETDINYFKSNIDRWNEEVVSCAHISKKRGQSFIKPELFKELLDLEIKYRKKAHDKGLLYLIADDPSRALR